VPAAETADCGAAALAMTLAYHGKYVPLAELHALTGTGRDGVTAAGIVDAARQLGLHSRAVRVDLDELDALPRGSILHWEMRHFVVFDRLRRDGVELVDPALGRHHVTMARFSGLFTGVAIVFDEDESFRRGDERPRKRWRNVRTLLPQRSALWKIVLLSALLQVFALSVAVFTGLIVNQVVGHDDSHLLAVLAVAAFVVVAYQTLITLLRSHLLLRLRTKLDVTMTVGFLEHLVDLPYAFFLTRTSGDLMMRMNSNATVRELLTSGAISAIIDGSFASLNLIILFVLSPTLGLLAALLGTLQVLVLSFARRPNARLMAESLQAQAKTQGYAYEMLAGIETLKASGRELRSIEAWTTLFVDEVNVSVRAGKVNALVDAATAGLRLLSPLAILLVGAHLVVKGDLELGTMLALAALATGFLAPLATLVSTGLQLQVLGSYLDRLDDVLDTPTEHATGLLAHPPELTGDICAAQVSFQYTPRAPEVIHDLSLQIRPGQKVGITGPSGSGKSTLGRLLAGLYSPTSGTVMHDGIDLTTLEPRAVRAQLGVVTQNAQLFATSIDRNIALSDPTLPVEAVERAARLACIHDDITAMPMRYDTPIIDGGASLSGGQRQRIALARALVCRPHILFLDEATSALDTLTEAAIYRNLRTLDATQVVIAHRLSTIEDADVIFVLNAGCIVESGTHTELLAQGGLYATMAGSVV
jgi:ABC-type bacteriocin/lantibiotic exporter with double-glycine peptidase domain